MHVEKNFKEIWRQNLIANRSKNIEASTEIKGSRNKCAKYKKAAFEGYKTGYLEETNLGNSINTASRMKILMKNKCEIGANELKCPAELLEVMRNRRSLKVIDITKDENLIK